MHDLLAAIMRAIGKEETGGLAGLPVLRLRVEPLKHHSFAARRPYAATTLRAAPPVASRSPPSLLTRSPHSQEGDAPLHVAAHFGRAAIAQALIDTQAARKFI